MKTRLFQLKVVTTGTYKLYRRGRNWVSAPELKQIRSFRITVYATSSVQDCKQVEIVRIVHYAKLYSVCTHYPVCMTEQCTLHPLWKTVQYTLHLRQDHTVYVTSLAPVCAMYLSSFNTRLYLHCTHNPLWKTVLYVRLGIFLCTILHSVSICHSAWLYSVRYPSFPVHYCSQLYHPVC
jgi:hypothetical protein